MSYELSGKYAQVVNTGRPTKMDPTKTKIVCEAIEAGSFEKVAAELAGIHVTTYWRWKRTGEKAELQDDQDLDMQPYREFYRAVVRSIALARLKAEHVVFKTNPLAWLTKGPGKKDWSDQRVEVTTKNESTIDFGRGAIDPTKLSTEQLYALRGLLEQCDARADEGSVEEDEP